MTMILVLGDGEATAHALTAAKQLGGDEIHILDAPPNVLAEPLAHLPYARSGRAPHVTFCSRPAKQYWKASFGPEGSRRGMVPADARCNRGR